MLVLVALVRCRVGIELGQPASRACLPEWVCSAVSRDAQLPGSSENVVSHSFFRDSSPVLIQSCLRWV